MAFKLNFISVVLVLCLLAMQASSECVARYGCNYAKAASLEIQSRKVLAGLDMKHGFYDENFVAHREMMIVPSGPDPMHHNGGSPKKPRTP